MPYGVDRNLGPGGSNSVSYETIGNAEDLSPILVRLDPKRTTFLSSFGTAEEATATDASWFTEPLRPPQMNAHFEMEEYKFAKLDSVEGLHNYIQHFQNTGYITETARKVKKVYNRGDEFDYAVTRAFKGQAEDIEYMLVNNKIKRKEQPGVAPALSGGVPYFMQLSQFPCTVDSASNVVTLTGITTANPSPLLGNGEFIYLTATEMPGGLVADDKYYIRLETDANENKSKFKLYYSLNGAVEGIESELVDIQSAGADVKIVMNNVVSLHDSRDWTLDDINNVMQMAVLRGGDPTDAYMSFKQKRKFSQIINGNLYNTKAAGSGTKFNDAVAVYEGDFGTVTAHSHHLYSDDRIDILDRQYMDLKWLFRTHEVTNLSKTGTYDKYAIASALMLKASQPKACASIVNIKRG